MHITQISVSYGVTQSLPDYCNIKPAITLTASVDEGEHPADVEAELLERARNTVHELVDRALEEAGQPARFDPSPRFQVIKSNRNRYGLSGHMPEPATPCVVILPDTADGQIEGCSHAFLRSRQLRYAYARRRAEEVADEEGRLIIDCADGDLSRIPPVVKPEAVEVASDEPPF